MLNLEFRGFCYRFCDQAMCLLLHFDDQTVLILNFTRFFYGTFDQALSFVVAGNETELCSSGRG